MLVALPLRTAPCRHQQNHRHAVRTGDGADLNGQLIGHGRHRIGIASQDSFGFRERIDQHARNDVGQVVQTNAHCGYDTEVSAAAAQCPEQIFFATAFGGNDAPIRQNNISGNQIVERQPEAADQRAIAAAQ